MNTIATTILEQLGGHRFVAMTGARDLVAGEHSLGFRIAGRSPEGKRVNWVRVVLEPSDTYNVQCFYIHNADCRLVAAAHGVYVDGLVETFERLTGLYAHL